MDKKQIYILLEINAKNKLLARNLNKIGLKSVDDDVYKMLETSHGSIDDILTEYFNASTFGIIDFMDDYIDSLGDECEFECLDGEDMYKAALEYFNVAE